MLEARGVFGSEGGVLELKETGSLVFDICFHLNFFTSDIFFK